MAVVISFLLSSLRFFVIISQMYLKTITAQPKGNRTGVFLTKEISFLAFCLVFDNKRLNELSELTVLSLRLEIY